MSINLKIEFDAMRSVDEKVRYLLAQMTIDEKIAQIAGLWVTDVLDEQRRFDSAKAETALVNGTGHITRISAASFLPPLESARLANIIQKHLVENTRLGIPAIVHEESCAGFMARGATSFPQSIGLAATWEPELIEEMAGVVRDQMRAVGAHHALAPVLDVVRDARWGRVEETYGEDPYLISNIGLAYVKGIQTDDIKNGVVATGKHFAAHGVPEGGLNWAPVHMNKRELREIFLTPFKTAIQEGNLASMMNAYHEWDGIPCGCSHELMVDILRDELGFSGVVVSDYFTLKTLVDYHHVAHDKAEAAKMGLEVGIDVELPMPDCYGEPLKQAIENGDVAIELLDASVYRVLKMKIDLGLFDAPYVDENAVLEVFERPEQRDLTRKLAQKSLVLLKNESLLPLSKSLNSIAVIGPIADSARCLQGDYHYPAHMIHIFEQMLSDDAPMPQGQNTAQFSWDDHFPPTVTILDAIKNAVSGQTEVRYAQGCDVLSDDTSGFEDAVLAATGADVVVMVVGDKSGLGEGSTVGESNDSATLELPGVQQALLEAIHATGTPIVMICVTGRPYVISWADAHIPAIIEAWLPAEQGGNALADVLFGDVNPGGKLPITFPRSVGQMPAYYNHKPSGGRSNWHTDYMDMSVKPLYAFGHGLSYTQFAYSNLTLSQHQATADDVVLIHVTVQNVGECAGDEVVQLYLSDPVATVTRPVKMLKGFKRLALEPGEEVTLCFHLDMRHLAFYNQKMDYIVECGQIEVMVGSSSEDIRLNDSIEIMTTSRGVEQVFLTPVTLENGSAI